MKVLKLDPNDSEVFEYKTDCERINFFHKHRDAFNKMWEEQGKTFWLRFLITFQIDAETKIIGNTKFEYIIQKYGDKLFDFVLIFIHKNFIEATEHLKTPDNIVLSTFKKAKSLNVNKNETQFSIFDSKNNICESKNFNIFQTNIETFDLNKNYPTLACYFIVVMHLGFCNGLCVLLKRWLKESDLNEDDIKTIDYTLYYWRPINQWEKEDFKVGCFEKYLSVFWNNDLPKMLLTCNVHEIFSHHIVENCCNMYTRKEIDINVICKVKSFASNSMSLNVVRIFSPDVTLCDEHSSCFVKILHSDSCFNPYICFGGSPCTLTCETVSKKNWSKDTSAFFKTMSIEISENEEENKRTVCTQTESSIRQIETFCPASQSSTNNQISPDLAEFLYSQTDPIFRNSYTQHKRKEEYRQKLRKKLHERYEYDSKDPIQLKMLYDRAKRIFLSEAAGENLKNLLSQPHASKSEMFEKLGNIISYNPELTSVAIGTSGIVFGLIVLPTKICTHRNKIKLDNQIDISSESNSIGKSKRKRKKKATNSSLESNKIVEMQMAASVEVEMTPSELNSNEIITNSNNAVKVSESLSEDKSTSDDELNTFYNFVNTKEGNASNCDAKMDVDHKELTTDFKHNSKPQNIEETNCSSSDKPQNIDETNCSSSDKPQNIDETNCSSSDKKYKVRSCAFCLKVETEYRTFKRCSLCKSKNLPDQYYYCSRVCQIADWEKSHREMHAKMGKK